MNRSEKLIYLAGFFDGEGCIHLSRYRRAKGGSNGASLGLILVQTDDTPLKMFLELFPQAKMGVTHRRQKQHGEGRAYYQVRVHGKAAADALVEMLPYLVVKRDEAKVAIDYQDAVNAFKGGQWSKHWTPEMIEYRNQTAEKLSLLKRRAGATTESSGNELSDFALC